MSEPPEIDRITHLMGAGMADGMNRSRALRDVLRTFVSDARAGNESAARIALNQARIAATVLKAEQDTSRFAADMAGKVRDQDRKDEELEWKRNASVQDSRRRDSETAARIGESGLRQNKIRLEAVLSVLEDQRKQALNETNIGTATARTRTAQTEEAIRVAEFEDRQTGRDTELKQAAERHRAELDLLAARNEREQSKNDLEMQLTRQRIDIGARAAGLQETIAEDRDAHKIDVESAGAFAAAVSTAADDPAGPDPAEPWNERFTADTGTRPDDFVAAAQDGRGPDPDDPRLVEAIAVVAEQVVIRQALRDLDPDPGASTTAATAGEQIGQTITEAVPSPEAAAAADVEVPAEPQASGLDLEAGLDTGPGR